jgi:hypothetical protein
MCTVNAERMFAKMYKELANYLPATLTYVKLFKTEQFFIKMKRNLFITDVFLFDMALRKYFRGF